MLYPLKFKKVLIPKIWGGQNLKKQLNIALPDKKNYGESWEVSSHPNGMSVVENGIFKGRTLQNIYEEYTEKLVGKDIYLKHKEKFPLLIKYLDVNDKLSIQVHPDDEYAMKNHNELGKYESWYILYASDDAKLIMGMKQGYNKEKFLEKVQNNDFSNMFNEISIKTGDLIDVIPGTVHASLKGSIIFAEIQENSDITYRIYDFDRLENGQKRQLHLKQAADVIDFDRKISITNTDLINGNRKNISNTPYYSIDKIKINDSFADFYENMIIYSILSGKASIKSENYEIDIEKGETILIPANIKIKIEGNVEILRTIAK